MTIQKISRLLMAAIFAFNLQLAYAATLQQAKADGWIGEQNNGYIGFVDAGAPADVKKLVADVNAKRRTIYSKLASKQKISLKEVENVAGKRNINKTASGKYIQNASGNWTKK